MRDSSVLILKGVNSIWRYGFLLNFHVDHEMESLANGGEVELISQYTLLITLRRLNRRYSIRLITCY